MVSKAPQTTKSRSKVSTKSTASVRSVARSSSATSLRSPLKKRSTSLSVHSRARKSSRPLVTFGKKTLRAILLSRTLHVASKAVVMLVLVSGALYGAYFLVSNTFAGDVVISKSEIVARVGRQTVLPSGNPDAVVRVQDAETLRKQNAFYADVKEGDYIIMYPTLAVIYSLRTDSLVNVKRIEVR